MMTCKAAQEMIVESEQPSVELSSHLAGCAGCREFFALQRSLDEQLEAEFTPPPLSVDFRAGVRTLVSAEKRKQRRDALAPLIAPLAGLTTTGVCALAVPEISAFLLAAGLIFSTAGYIGHVLFVWLIEELGEG